MEFAVTRKVAVILFNLGGPDSLEAVRPFLFNLFYDPAIFRVPNPLRWFLANLVSKKRTPVAQEIYRQMDGRSPILPLTMQQANELERDLMETSPTADTEFRAFICMRYWHPMTESVVQDVKAWGPDEVVLLPLYPQYSTTTTASSVKKWQEECIKAGLMVITKLVCCYPVAPSFIQAHVELIRKAWDDATRAGRPRLLLSAHGLPEKVIKDGDPYQWQVEQTASAIVNALDIPNLDYQVSYQSRVGPMKWIGPSTDDEIRRAGKEGVSLVVVPVAFVSDHSETLVELDVEYKHLAEKEGVLFYSRVAALNSSELFSRSLGSAVRQVLALGAVKPPDYSVLSQGNARICPKDYSACPCFVTKA
ncbi:ferrochelatase [bacterium]|nr:ferrochelatase [bacterium]